MQFKVLYRELDGDQDNIKIRNIMFVAEKNVSLLLLQII